MATGYTRQSAGVIITGNTIQASDFNNEFNLLEDFADATVGHNHDGTVGGGAKITASALNGLTAITTGIVVQTGATTFTVRTITGTAAEITVTNGTGVSGAPILSLPTALTFTGKTITGGAHVAISSLGIRSTGAAFDLTLASSEVLTAGRTLSFVLGDAARTLTIGASASVSGSNTGDQTNISGNAATATKLATARAINGTSFDGTADITVTAAAGTLTGTTLAATVVTSSLTSVGTIGTGVWQGTIITSAYGGTGNGFTKFTGPASTEKTFALPNASDTIATYGVANVFTQVQTINAASTTPLIIYNNTGASTLSLIQFKAASSTSLGYIGSTTTQPFVVYEGGGTTIRTAVDSSGNLTPGGDNLYSLGTSTLRWTNVNTAAINGAQIGGFRNFVINGALEINQRFGVGGVLTGNNATYQLGSDRWAGFANTGTTLKTVNGISNAPFNNAYHVQRTAGSTQITTAAVVQAFTTLNSLKLAGQTVTFSFWARCGADLLTSGAVLQILVGSGTGTDQSATSFGGGGWPGSASIISPTPTLTTSWQKFSYTGTFSSSITQVGVYIGRQTMTATAAGANDWFEFTGVQLEIGATATPFEFRNFEAELAMCQAYYRKTFPYATLPAQNAGLAGALSTKVQSTTAATAESEWNFGGEMRGTPTITTYNPSAANANWRDVTGSSDVVVSVDPNTAKSSGRVEIATQTTVLTVGRSLYIHATADAEL